MAKARSVVQAVAAEATEDTKYWFSECFPADGSGTYLEIPAFILQERLRPLKGAHGRLLTSALLHHGFRVMKARRLSRSIFERTLFSSKSSSSDRCVSRIKIAPPSAS